MGSLKPTGRTRYVPGTRTGTMCRWKSVRCSKRGRAYRTRFLGLTCGWWMKTCTNVPADATTVGEVVMRGNNVMLGYYLEPEATATAFRGGWFHSGDLAVMHPDGYIEVRDRAKDIIISGGENISSLEVERVLYEHPAVLEAAIVARPDEKWGEVPHAYVLLREDALVSEQELIEFCRERLAHFKCPKAIHFGALPKTSTGKIRKNVLRHQSRAAAEGDS